MSSPKIEAPLLEILQDQTAKAMVSMSETTEAVLQSLENREFADREERLNTMNRELTELAEKSQKNVVELLEREKDRIPITWSSLWISNQIIVEGADLQLVEAIAAIDNVRKIEGDKMVDLL